MEVDPIVQLSAELNSLKEYLSQSRQRIGQIAARAGIIIEMNEFCE